MVEPDTPASREKHHKFGQRISFVGCKSEFIFLPLARNVLDLCLRVAFSPGLIRLQRHGYLSGEVTRLQPEIAVIGNALPDRNSALVDAPSLTVAGGDINAQRMFNLFVLEVAGDRVKNRIVPMEADRWIIIAVIGLPFPVA